MCLCIVQYIIPFKRCFLEKLNFIQQRCIILIRSDNKHLYIVITMSVSKNDVLLKYYIHERIRKKNVSLFQQKCDLGPQKS